MVSKGGTTDMFGPTSKELIAEAAERRRLLEILLARGWTWHQPRGGSPIWTSPDGYECGDNVALKIARRVL